MAFVATGRYRSFSPKKRKDNDQQDERETCDFEGANLVISIENKFINIREEFVCPRNPYSSEGNICMDAVEDQDQCTCTLPSGTDELYPANKPLPLVPAHCRSEYYRYRLTEAYWRRLRHDGLEKERTKSGTQEC